MCDAYMNHGKTSRIDVVNKDLTHKDQDKDKDLTPTQTAKI